MKSKTEILTYLIIFALLDLIIPFPVTVAVLIYILYKKPPWFMEWVNMIYEDGDDN